MDTFSCNGLYKQFDGTEALSGINIQFPEFGFTALIGRNGAGKTTLFNILTGYMRPDAGRCFLGEREITHLASYQIARLGIARTFQEPRLIFQLSALENILLARRYHHGESLASAILRLGVAKEEAEMRKEALDLLASVNLKHAALEPARHLSYGQQKLLNLVCCIATGARILLLDEPVTGVHPEVAANILQLTQQYLQQQRLVIFIEHDIHVVRQVAEQVIVLDSGKVIAQGAAHDVLTRPEVAEVYLV
jgi:ABC-type branched-subunit amino acid transport system ATPase component